MRGVQAHEAMVARRWVLPCSLRSYAAALFGLPCGSKDGPGGEMGTAMGTALASPR